MLFIHTITRRAKLIELGYVKRKILNPDSPDFDPNGLLTPQQTSDLLSVSVATLSVWRSTGRYEMNFVKCGRLIRYKAADVLLFLEQRTYSRTGRKANG